LFSFIFNNVKKIRLINTVATGFLGVVITFLLVVYYCTLNI